MTQSEYNNIIDSHPTLTAHGFGVDQISYYTEKQRTALIQRERPALYNYYEDFLKSVEYLKLLKRRKSVNNRVGTTYGLKHKVERWVYRHTNIPCYIHEGAFIAAAIALGFTMKPQRGSTSVYLNISNNAKVDGQWIHSM